ncbi:DUF2249 domain-containing protein [Fulvivirga sp. 29W222]|uniref:DUF2249 domain-containing protein n=1 Tax=Fulvivirga marina TaxID=2494733 RepID=A0A937G3F7_9BACT|nr:DUF2249 domain-containing protein [Fulvivirga marina]
MFFPSKQRSPAIFNHFDEIKPDEIFKRVNDHAHTPLYYQFQTEHRRQFEWNYCMKESETQKVHVAKVKQEKV